MSNVRGTALVQMILAGNTVAANVLLDAHADPNLASERGGTPLAAATENKRRELVVALIKHGASVSAHEPNREPLIMLAVRCGDLPIIEIILQAKADPNEITDRQETALSVAIDSRKAAIVSLLLKYGANPNQHTERSAQFLARAIAQQDLEMVKALLSAKANVDVKDSFGNTPLMSVIQSGDDAMIELLLGAKPDVNITDSRGRTALLMAATAGQLETTQKLLEAHANPNILDIYGQTVLDHLDGPVGSGNEAIVALLKQHGAHHAVSLPRAPRHTAPPGNSDDPSLEKA